MSNTSVEVAMQDRELEEHGLRQCSECYIVKPVEDFAYGVVCKDCCNTQCPLCPGMMPESRLSTGYCIDCEKHIIAQREGHEPKTLCEFSELVPTRRALAIKSFRNLVSNPKTYSDQALAMAADLLGVKFYADGIVYEPRPERKVSNCCGEPGKRWVEGVTDEDLGSCSKCHEQCVYVPESEFERSINRGQVTAAQ